MANVVNRYTAELIESVNTPDYDPVDWLINPDLSGVQGVPNEFWVVHGDAVTWELKANHIEQHYDDRGRLMYVNHWHTKTAGGEYQDLAERIDYTYTDMSLTAETISRYRPDGTVYDVKKYSFVTEDMESEKIIHKVKDD